MHPTNIPALYVPTVQHSYSRTGQHSTRTVQAPVWLPLRHVAGTYIAFTVPTLGSHAPRVQRSHG